MSAFDMLRKGMVIRWEGQLYTVLDYHQAQTGKQKPTVHIKLRSLQTGRTTERTLDEIGSIDEVPTETREFQYLYQDGDDRVFMDTQTYEQYPVRAESLGDAADFLVEEQTYRFLTVEGTPVVLQLPPQVVLEVVDTAPPEHAGGTTNVYKEARLASGLVIQVPLFIKTGDKVRVTTDSRQYQGKEH